VQDNGSVNRLKKDELNKTGRHFSQIEEVLQQIKEEDKGE
jgi:hypothetical protein